MGWLQSTPSLQNTSWGNNECPLCVSGLSKKVTAKMAKIQTVLGAVEATAIGPTDIHDHLYRDSGTQVSMDTDFLINDVEKSTCGLQAFYDAGGRCLVEAEPLGARKIEAIVDIAQRVPVHVIAATGFHREPLYFDNFWGRFYTLEEITPFLSLRSR